MNDHCVALASCLLLACRGGLGLCFLMHDPGLAPDAGAYLRRWLPLGTALAGLLQGFSQHPVGQAYSKAVESCPGPPGTGPRRSEVFEHLHGKVSNRLWTPVQLLGPLVGSWCSLSLVLATAIQDG